MVNSYSMWFCLLMHGKRQTAMNDEWKLYAIKGKSEPDSNSSVNPPDFGFAKNCRIPTNLNLDSNYNTSLAVALIITVVIIYYCDRNGYPAYV